MITLREAEALLAIPATKTLAPDDEWFRDGKG